MNLNELVNSVVSSMNEKEQQKVKNLVKRVDYLQKYSKENDVTTVVRIPVPHTILKSDVVQGKMTYNKWLDTYEYNTIEHKEYTVTDENIVKAIKAIFPDDVENSIHWFDSGNYYFCTDKKIPYNLRKQPRQLQENEKTQITSILNTIETNKKDVEELMLEGRTLIALETDEAVRTDEQKQLVKSHTAIMLLMKLDKELKRETKKSCYCYGENHDLNMYGETPQASIVRTWLNEIRSLKEEHIQMVKKSLETIEAIYNKCEEEPVFFIHPMKQNKQLKIYIAKNRIQKYENLGYTVQEKEQELTTRKFSEVKGSLVEEENTYTKTSYFFQIALKSFITSCIHGSVCRKGYYFGTDGEEIEQVANRPCEAVTITDTQGVVHSFNSKSEAAKHFNVSNKVITNTLKSDGVLNLKNEKNRKNITLVTSDNRTLVFSSMTDAAKELNCNKMAISRAMKNKVKGDVVSISGIQYTIQ